MQVWVIALIVLVCGGVGGFVNALLAGDLRLPRRDADMYSPGWIGNVIIGAVAALVFWGIYGPMAKVAVIGPDTNEATKAIFTISELAGSVVTGIGGGRILSSEVEKRALTKMKESLTDALLE
jgi:heme/copper-type cytochrome/quinol oxidase subunit 1